ncbi:hypothetical protein PMAYCL1PPCAC_31129 [Pristionchus mayeri]|uniref:Uncharacterized protein n=1 Tax=Pristionchus mayeri TaxID=1317129 RepID=A0AAN5DD66_9BILA|nr:hypothetical protein PMAYCL1PPCAC_31129 [Pristionchus mayeri]
MNSSLVILVSVLTLGAAQMTFSDGWEKRQPSRPFSHHYAHQKVTRSGGHSFQPDAVADAAGADEKTPAEASTKNDKEITPITTCMEEYMNGIRQLHAAMMELYGRFQTCENAVANPLLSGTQGKTSPARY